MGRIYGKKDSVSLRESDREIKMLLQLYRNTIASYLTPDQLITLEILVWLVQNYKQIKIERLAAYLPLPIKYESRRRRLQRFLKLPALSISLIWLPIIQKVIEKKIKKTQRLYIVLDRTQWQDKNLFMVGAIMSKRALPIYWQFLNKIGASNLAEQKAILRPVIKLFKDYEIVILGDREFHSVELAKWLTSKKVYFVLRQKKNTNIQIKRQDYYRLDDLKVSQGSQLFLRNIKVTKQWQVTQISMGVYWKRKYRGMGEKEPWYLLTNLPNLSEAVKAYKKRVGIEAMFKDCKTGGYNLESTKASVERLTRLVLLIAIAYTNATLKGQSIRIKRQSKYINRFRIINKNLTYNSHFWIGMYGTSWIIHQEFVKEWVAQLIRLNPNKLPFYHRGQRAMSIIQQAF